MFPLAHVVLGGTPLSYHYSCEVRAVVMASC